MVFEDERRRCRESLGPEETFSSPVLCTSRHTPFQPSRVLERTVTIICRGQKCQHKGQAHSPPGLAAITTWLCGTRSNDRV